MKAGRSSSTRSFDVNAFSFVTTLDCHPAATAVDAAGRSSSDYCWSSLFGDVYSPKTSQKSIAGELRDLRY